MNWPEAFLLAVLMLCLAGLVVMGHKEVAITVVVVLFVGFMVLAS